MAVVFKNNAKTTLASGITSSATSITVADGSVFPTLTGSDTFFCTLDDGTNIEIVEVTAISSNTLTVTRAQDNTSATSFSTGTVAELRLTAGILNLFSQTGSDINAEVEAYLDANGLTLPDDVKAQFGDNNDLQLYHDGSNSYIKDAGAGNLVLQGNSYIELKGTNNEFMAFFKQDGQSALYYDASKKFETTSGGVSVSGELDTTGNIAINKNNAKLTINNNTANTQASIDIKNTGLYARYILDNDDLFRIYNQTSAFDTFAVKSNGDLYMGSTKWFDLSRNLTNIGTISSGKIEGTTADANGHILKTDSSTASASDVALQIRNSSADYNLKFQPRLPAGNMHAGVNTDDFGIFTSNSKGISIGNNDKSLVVIHPTDGLEFWTNNARRFNLDTSGNIQVNGTTILNQSRNLTNIGTISSGAITSSGVIDVHTGDSGIILKSGNSSATGTPDQFQIEHSFGNVNISNARGVINLSNIGTISSGAITATGTTTLSGLTVDGAALIRHADSTAYSDSPDWTAQTFDTLQVYNDNGGSAGDSHFASIYMRADGGGNAAARIILRNDDSGNGRLYFQMRSGSHTNETKPKLLITDDGQVTISDNATTYNERLFVDGNLRVEGVYKSGTQTIIDASRNLTNIGTISSGTITTSGEINFTSATSYIRNQEDASGQIVISALNSSSTARAVRWDAGNDSGGAFRPADSGISSLGLTNRIWDNLFVNTIKIGSSNTTVIDSSANLTNVGTISSGAITSSGTLKSTNATGLVLDTGASYRDVQFVLTGNTGNGTLEIIPMTVPGSGTASFTTHIKNLSATGTTRHDLKVDGNATFSGTINSGAITSTSAIAANNGGNVIQLSTDGSIEITRTAGGAYIDFKNSSSEDYDARIAESSGSFNFTATDLKIAGSEFIDNSRNLHSDVRATTQSAGDNSTKIATTAYTETAIANLVDGAPSTLNTLNELAAALNDNADILDQFLPLSGGTMTGNLSITKETPYFNLTDSSASRTLGIFVDDNNSVLRSSGQLLLQIGSISALTIDTSRNATFAGTISSGNISIGTADSANGTLTIHGGGSGNAEGGEIRLQTSADYDGTYDFYRIDTVNDDFRIGRAGTTDLTITETGNLSIGTGTPLEKLSVGNSRDVNFHIGGHRIIAFGYAPGASNVTTYQGKPVEIRHDPSAGSLRFGVDATARNAGDAASVTSRLTITSSQVNAAVPIAMGGTNVMDASRNLINIGTGNFAGDVTLSGGSGKLIYTGMGSLLHANVSTFTTVAQHDLLYWGWTSGISDYIYLKAGGNSTGTHGTLVVADSGLFYGVWDNETGGLASSSTNPITTTRFRVDNGGNATFSGTINSGAITSSDSITLENGGLILGEDAYSTSSHYVGMKSALMTGSSDYMIISAQSTSGDNGHTYVSAKDGQDVYIRGGGNNSGNQIQVTDGSYILATTSQLRFTGGLYSNTTQVIDSSRNLTNIGTISSSYFYTSSNINLTGVAGFTVGGGRIGFDQSGTRSWTMGASSGYLNVFSGDGNGDLNLANSIGLRQNGTLVLDSSRNLSNIGNITTSGTVDAGGRVKVTNWIELESSGASLSAEEAGLRWDYNDSVLWYFYKDNANDGALHIQSAATSGESDPTPRVRFHRTARETYFGGAIGVNKYSVGSGLNLDVAGAIGISGTTIIDSSRNLTNIGTISSGAITSSGAISAYGNSDTVAALEIYSNSNHGMRILHRGTDGDFSFERRVNGTNTEFLRIGRGTGNATFAGTISSGAVTSTGNSVFTGSGSSGTSNAFLIRRGSDNSGAFRVQNDGVVVTEANYLYAASSGVSLYVQNSLVARGSILNDTSGQPVRVADDFNVTGVYQANGTTVIDASRNLTNIGTIAAGKTVLTGEGSTNTYSSLLKTVNTSSDQWGHITLGGSATNSVTDNYYLIGRGSSVGAREMSFHIPNDGNYGDSTQPKFRFASSGSDTLFTVEAETGTAFHKGTVQLGSSNTALSQGTLNALRIQTNSGRVDIGAMNASFCHIDTDRPQFYFNKKLIVDEGIVASYDEDLALQRASVTKLNLGANNHNFYGAGTAMDVQFGSSTQTAYTNLVWNTDDGNAQLFKAGSTYTGWGGADAFNIYSSNGNLCFHPQGTANAFKVTPTTAEAISNIYADGGNLIMGDAAYSTSTDYVGMKTSFQSGSSDYMIISGLSDGDTYISAKNGGAVNIRGGGNYSSNQISVPDGSTITATTSDFRVTGNVTAYVSDKRLKTNIKTIENPIEKIKKIRGVEFDWIDNIENFNPKFEHETGVIAQEIEEVIPDAVSPAPFNEEYKTVDKEKIVALLIEAIKDQQKEIEYMKSEIKTLKENNNGN